MLKQQLCMVKFLVYREFLKVGVGLAYTTSVNIKTDDGLINGATCILKKIHYFKSNASKCPDILWVLFDDETIGKLWRQKYSAYHNEGIGKTWTPIFGVTRHFAVSNGKVMQTQFPLKPAFGTTILGAKAVLLIGFVRHRHIWFSRVI